MCRKFNPAENDYYIELDKEQAYPTIKITPSSDNEEVEGGLVQQIETIAGETKKQIKVKTAEGIEFVYNLYFYRKPSSNSYLKNIKVAGKDIENYKEETLRYEIELPYNVEENTRTNYCRRRRSRNQKFYYNTHNTSYIGRWNKYNRI